MERTIREFQIHLIVFISLCICRCYGDYQCVCSYNVELPVYDKLNTQDASKIGYLYEFDCKPKVDINLHGLKLYAVAFEHQLGYVHDNSQVEEQVCPGDLPTLDRLKTTPSTTSSIITTPMSSQTISTASSTPLAIPSTKYLSTSPHSTLPLSTSLSTLLSSPSKHSSTTNLASSNSTPVSSTLPALTFPTTDVATRVSTTSVPQATPRFSATFKTFSSTPTSATSSTSVPTSSPPTATPTFQSTTIPTTSSLTASTGVSKTSLFTKLPTQTESPSTQAFTSSSTAKTVTGKHHTLIDASILAGNTHLCQWRNIDPLNLQTQYGQHCYEFVYQSPRAWPFAELYCQTHSGHLLSINGLLEEEYIYQVLVNHRLQDIPVWIGLSDALSEGKQQWTDGTRVDHVTFIKWKHLPDATSLGDDCVVSEVTRNENILDDINCNTAHPFICKYDPTRCTSAAWISDPTCCLSE